MPAPPPVAAKRSYDSSRRTRQAAQTRDEVLWAAMALFRERGWAGTTLAAIAEAAGVSVETIYKGFSSKKGLLRAAMDVGIVGDSEPIPFAERPEALAMGEGSRATRIARAAELVATVQGRTAGVWQAIVEAASADEEVDAWRIELEQGRLVEIRRSAELILGKPAGEQLTLMLWVLYGPETYLKLVNDAGLSREEYEALIIEGTNRLIAKA